MTGPPALPAPSGLLADDATELRRARERLETRSFLIALATLLGEPLERIHRALPDGWQQRIALSSRSAMLRALEVALRTLGRDPSPAPRLWLDRALVGASGGVAGAVGLAALPVELPFSTAIILRSIADIARSEGADLDDLDTRLACLEVFALGGPDEADDAADSGYWTTRAALAQLTTEASRHLAAHGLAQTHAPALVRFVNAVAARFGVVVGEQIVAKAVPVVGALGGSAVNALFMAHFQNLARGHFVVRRLETVYGEAVVREAWEAPGTTTPAAT